MSGSHYTSEYEWPVVCEIDGSVISVYSMEYKCIPRRMKRELHRAAEGDVNDSVTLVSLRTRKLRYWAMVESNIEIKDWRQGL